MQNSVNSYLNCDLKTCHMHKSAVWTQMFELIPWRHIIVYRTSILFPKSSSETCIALSNRDRHSYGTGGGVRPSHFQCGGKKKNSCSCQKSVLNDPVHSYSVYCPWNDVHFYKLVKYKAWYFMDVCVRRALCAACINGIILMWYQMLCTFCPIKQQ